MINENLLLAVCLAAIWLLGVWSGWRMCQRNTKVGTPSASHNSRRNAISKKDAEYSRSMYRLEDEQDTLDAVDFGEAYNFHADCGDR
jgi:hypothetical protein